MNAEQFKAICKSRGIAKSSIVKRYIEKYKKNDYTENDLIECYRIENAHWCSRSNTNHQVFTHSGWGEDGSNYVSVKIDKM